MTEEDNSSNSGLQLTTLLWPDEVSRQQDRVFLLGHDTAHTTLPSSSSSSFIDLLHDDPTDQPHPSTSRKQRLMKEIPNVVYFSIGSKGHHWEVIQEIQQTFAISTVQTYCFPSLRKEIKRKLHQITAGKLREEKRLQRNAKKFRFHTYQPLQLVVIEGIDRLTSATIRQIDFIYSLTDALGEKNGLVVLFTMNSIDKQSGHGHIEGHEHEEEDLHEASHDEEHDHHHHEDDEHGLEHHEDEAEGEHEVDFVGDSTTSSHSHTDSHTRPPTHHQNHHHTSYHQLLMERFNYPEVNFNGNSFIGRVQRFAIENQTSPSIVKITPTTICRHLREERDALIRTQRYQKMFTKQFDGVLDFSTVLALVSIVVILFYCLKWLRKKARIAVQQEEVQIQYKDQQQEVEEETKDVKDLTPEERQRLEDEQLAKELLTQWRTEKKRQIVPDDEELDAWKTPAKTTRTGRKSMASEMTTTASKAGRRNSLTSTARKERTQLYAPLGMVSALKGSAREIVPSSSAENLLPSHQEDVKTPAKSTPKTKKASGSSSKKGKKTPSSNKKTNPQGIVEEEEEESVHPMATRARLKRTP